MKLVKSWATQTTLCSVGLTELTLKKVYGVERNLVVVLSFQMLIAAHLVSVKAQA